MEKEGLVIVGTGLAGYMLAKEMRKLDALTPLTLITADDGAFYSKPLLSTALTQQKTADQLQISSAIEMAKELSVTIYAESFVNAVDLAQHQLTLVSSSAVKEERNITFSRLVFACGADPIRPLLSGNALEEIYSVNDLMGYRRFRHWLQGKKRIAILGAGLVGCEFANDLLNAGYQLDIIAPENHPLSQLVPEPLGLLLQEALARQGATWHLGHLATEVNKEMNPSHHPAMHYRITLSNGEELIVDGVLSAVGLRPRIRLAKSAGIMTDRGIVVNRWLQTDRDGIYALGDCAQVDGLVQLYVAPLLQCARALAKILAGHSQDPVSYPVMPVVIKTPACPLVSVPPPSHVMGEWHFEGEGHHQKALFFDHEGQLRGFALVGDKVREKISLAKELPVILA